MNRASHFATFSCAISDVRLAEIEAPKNVAVPPLHVA
jgi:hypothetical protein